MKAFKVTLLLTLISVALQAQMLINSDTLYGNEWINYNQSYYKIAVVEDGFYKISYQELNTAGVFSGTNPLGSNFQLFSHGKEIPIHISQNGAFGSNDFIAFYGERNKGQLDSHIYLDPSYQTNTEYSIFTDTTYYFLTWNTSNNHLHYLETANDLINPPGAEPYCWAKIAKAYYSVYDPGIKRANVHGSWNAGYDIGEGFANQYSADQSVSINTPMIATSGPEASASLRYRSTEGSHHLNLLVNGNLELDTTFSGTAVNEHYLSISPSDLADNNTFKLTGDDNNNDQYGLSVIRITYPRQMNFSGASNFSFSLDGASTKKYLEISNFAANGIAPFLYDRTANIFLETTLDNGLIKVVLPPFSNKRELILVSTNAYKTVQNIKELQFVNYDDDSGDYLIISHPVLMGNGSGPNYVQEYADYRSSFAGGQYDPVVVDVNQLYDQFAYGEIQHEIAIRNFTHYAVKNWDSKYLFLIGKGASYGNLRFGNTYNDITTLIPTFGLPQSDNLLAASNTSNVPIIPVGRLAAKTPEHVDIYLRKVIDFESNATLPQTIEDKAWMKRIIHLGGGDAPIQDFIRNELTEVEEIAEKGKFGADIYPFYKTSTDVIQETPAEQIQTLINDGVSMITFFGHSAPATLDYNLESPESYNNQGKYPFVYTIGCHTSRMFEFDGTLTEQWVLAEDKGAIAFLGATWETTLSNLSAYAKFFYQNMMEDHYGESIGDILKATIEDFDLNSSFYAEQLKQVMVLHGDPALRINTHIAPDYVVDATSVSTNPALISAQMDSFNLSVNAINIGSAVKDSFLVSVKHELPNGTVLPSIEYKTTSPGFEGIYNLNIPIPKEDILGFNKLNITIDALDSIPELPNPTAEMNNSYDHTFYVVANDAFPVYPYEYSIISNPDITLKASTANAFAEKQKYYLEIDTTNYFNSPQKRQTIVEQIGGVVSWSPPISYQNNTAYYWRISIDSTLTTGFGYNWHESSFLYKEDSSPGWNQSHFHQLKNNNELVAVELEEPNRKINFSEDINEIRIKTGPWTIAGDDQMSAIVNGGVIQIYKGCMPDGLHAVVLDPVTLAPWVNPPGGLYNSISCQNYNFYSFPYGTTTMQERESLINFLENEVPSNHIVALYSIQTSLNSIYYDESWAMDSINNSFQKNIFQVLEEQGATKIRQLDDKGSVPYFFLYQKDNPDFLNALNYETETIADSVNTILDGIYLLNTPNYKGAIKSTKIGPASGWQSLNWNMEDYDVVNDETALKIYGIDNQENEFLIHENITVYDTSLTHINAEQFPYLRLELELKDSIERTSPHLDYWRIIYDPVPDAALRPDLNLAFHADTIQQGETLTLDIAVENITEIDMDSLLVYFTVVDQNNNAVLTGQRLAPLTKESTLTAHLDFNTKEITSSFNQLIVEVNPNEDQPEQHRFNNVGILPFYLIRDNRNPLLDVTFDGVHILDGDIVSANPLINIALLDENPHLALSDTSLFRIKLLHPEETVPRLISVSDPNVTFIPAEEGNLNKSNKARIEVRNSFELDGIYELTVEAKDATGNSAGTYDYKTHFEVINQAMISNVFNYPNPFSTQTQFVFTLTGADLPDFMKIQIMTVSGKVIREITQDELGPLHIGKNITDYRWDGTDEYGDRLGNGVYLYRVVTRKLDGELYEDYDTKTDQYFKHGIGKMVILR